MRLIIFDSGIGGFSVVRAIAALIPQAELVYLADTAVFPYGALEDTMLVERVMLLMERLVPAVGPAAVVIACNTASTLVLPPLRARFSIPIVGTVPAIKPAAEQSRSRLVSVLATPATVARDYTRDLIARHGEGCRFTLVGAPLLAGFVEGICCGAVVADQLLWQEIAPCFVEEEGRRTDHIVLACTHYPLIVDRLAALSPWPVSFIDPAPAIAHRVRAVTNAKEGALRTHRHRVLATGPLPTANFLARLGFAPAERFAP